MLVAYLVPVTSTGDAFWFLPTSTRADEIDVYRDGTRTSIFPGDQRYQQMMDAINDALSSPVGIELEYGLHPADVDALRSGGRAVEATYASEAHAHGRYPLGAFTRVLVPLSGPEHDRGLVFVGLGGAYRSGPVRSPAQVERLRALAEAVR